MSRGNISSSQWGSDGAYYVEFELRGGESRWYRFTGVDAAAVAGGADPRDHSGEQVDGPPSTPIGGGFGTASGVGGAAESGEIAELGIAGLL